MILNLNNKFTARFARVAEKAKGLNFPDGREKIWRSQLYTVSLCELCASAVNNKK